MPSGYFHRVIEETPTRLWVNNPTAEDMEKAIAAGAINVTTNPSYCSKLLQRELEPSANGRQRFYIWNEY